MLDKKKTLAALLAVCTLLGTASLAGCGKEDPPEKTTNNAAVTTDPEETTEAVETFTPTGKTYDGDEFVLLFGSYAGTGNYDFKNLDDTDASSRSTLDEAVYKKTKAVEELYDIKLNVIEDMGSKNTVQTKLMTAAIAGSCDYDAASLSAYSAVPLASNQALYELGSIQALDLSHSWWDQHANTELVINNCMFFTTGDISVWDDMQQHVVAFNKQLKADLNIEDDFYDLVREGNWTLDALAKYAKLATQDLNSDGLYDMSDRFGILTWDDSVYGVFNASGEKVVTIGDDGSLNLTLTGSERIVDVLTKYTDICFGGDAINYQRHTAQGAIDMFSSNRALFFLCRLQSLDNYRDMETDYGILPYPKYNEMQEEYHTSNSPIHMTYFAVPSFARDPEMSGAVLDALAYYGQTYLTPAYYEKTLTGQYFRDEESLETLELMAATRAYDIGFYIQPANINKELIFLFRVGSKDFASTFASYKDAATNALTAIQESYAEAAVSWGK